MTGNKEQAKLTAAMGLLTRAAEHLGDDIPPDGNWFKDYFVLTGEHMILTDEGWEAGSGKANCLANDIEIMDEVNAPAA